MAEQKADKQAEEVSLDEVAKNGLSSLEGKRYRRNAAVLIVMNATWRLIPDPATYSNLYDGAIISGPQMTGEPVFTSLPPGTILFKNSAGTVFMLDYKDPADPGQGTVKRGFTAPKYFNLYGFSWDKVKTLPDIVVNAIPNGQNFDKDTY